MTVSQADKARKFRALHEAPGAFVIANPWDAGSARLLAGLGFEVDVSQRDTFPGHVRFHAFDAHGNRVEVLAPR